MSYWKLQTVQENGSRVCVKWAEGFYDNGWGRLQAVLDRVGVQRTQAMLQQYAACLTKDLRSSSLSLYPHAVSKMRLIKELVDQRRWPIGKMFEQATAELASCWKDRAKAETAIRELLKLLPETSLSKRAQPSHPRCTIEGKKKATKARSFHSLMTGKCDSVVNAFLMRPRPRGWNHRQGKEKLAEAEQKTLRVVEKSNQMDEPIFRTAWDGWSKRRQAKGKAESSLAETRDSSEETWTDKKGLDLLAGSHGTARDKQA